VDERAVVAAAAGAGGLELAAQRDVRGVDHVAGKVLAVVAGVTG
jgi:hypothetical protein